jgi:hypothetical protein
MTDRELLERAAKVAGRRVYWRDGGLVDAGTGIHTTWNPLTNDGEALRLAVMLDISIRQRFAMVTAEYPWIEGICTRKTLCEGVLDDYCAATRRAIVRAADEIGRKP